MPRITKTITTTKERFDNTPEYQAADANAFIPLEEALAEFHDNTKQDKLTAGTNITIDENNVISADGASGTTLADYGITDAKIESVNTTHTITLGEHTITFEVVGSTLNITTT